MLLTSCHIMSCHVMSCHVMSCPVMSCHVLSRHVMSSHVLSRLVISGHVMSCHVMSCRVMSRHLARESCSRNFLPSLLNSSIMAAGWPDEVFETVALCGNPARSDALAVAPRALRASACGAVHIFATWASFCVAGCGDRACCEHAGRCVAGVSRRCAVGIGFRACFVHAWPTCVSRGRLRESRVLGACPERAGGPCRRRRAVGIGFQACRARMFLRAATCVSRGRRGTSDALMRSGGVSCVRRCAVERSGRL